MIDVTILEVRTDPTNGCWAIAQQVQERGSSAVYRHLHLVHPRAFVNHAVEYGLDPADSRTVLDWLLHERFVVYTDPRDPGPHCPYRNPPAQAWAAHRSNMAQVKSRVSISDPDGHLEKIHRAHSPGHAEVEAAHGRVAQTRAHIAHIETDRRTGRGRL